MNLTKTISAFLDIARALGLNEEDLNTATDFLNHKELGLAVDTVITQLYEYEIEIDQEFYILLEEVASRMNISEDGYVFMKELVRAEKVVPKPVKDKLAEIVKILKAEN